MDISGAGTAIMVALSAVLWFLCLLPSWMRRREFLATERNAARLQRAIRVMAESAEAPHELRVEASARDAAHAERLLAQERRREEALARAELRAAQLRAKAAEAHAAEVERLARERRASPAVSSVVSNAPMRALDRLRRARRLAGLLLLAALVVGGIQLWLMATTGIALGAWFVIAGCVAAAAASLRLQGRIAARARALTRIPAPRRERVESTLIDAEPAAQASRREWTPVPLPKPLYLEHGEAPRVSVVPPVTAEELLRAAAAEAERALAAAHSEPEVVPFRTRDTPQPSHASRFAAMGIVDDVDTTVPDLDEALRRRRSVG
jgi:hypothetical protein